MAFGECWCSACCSVDMTQWARVMSQSVCRSCLCGVSPSTASDRGGGKHVLGIQRRARERQQGPLSFVAWYVAVTLQAAHQLCCSTLVRFEALPWAHPSLVLSPRLKIPLPRPLLPSLPRTTRCARRRQQVLPVVRDHVFVLTAGRAFTVQCAPYNAENRLDVACAMRASVRPKYLYQHDIAQWIQTPRIILRVAPVPIYTTAATSRHWSSGLYRPAYCTQNNLFQCAFHWTWNVRERVFKVPRKWTHPANHPTGLRHNWPCTLPRAILRRSLTEATPSSGQSFASQKPQR